MPTKTPQITTSPRRAAKNAPVAPGKTMPKEKTTKTTTRKSSGKNAAVQSPLSAEQIEHFQGLLLAERARLEEEREQIRGRSGAVDSALPEEGEGGEDDTADLASAMMDKEMDLSVEDEIEEMLGAVDHALQKIVDGTYGICDMSGETIRVSRLELIPWAALTVECQAIAEGE